MKKPKLIIAHGKVTHKLGAKCKFCTRVLKEYKKNKHLISPSPNPNTS